MTTDSAASVPAPWPALSNQPGARRAWVGRLAAAVCTAIAVALIVFQERYRVGETWLAGEVVRTVTGQYTWHLPGHPVLYFQTSPGSRIMGILVSLACSSALLVAPLFLVSGALFLSRTRSRLRVLLATLVAFLVIAAANNIRLVLIVVFAGHYGETGLDWAHILIGTLVMLTAGGIAILLYLKIGAGSRKEGR